MRNSRRIKGAVALAAALCICVWAAPAWGGAGQACERQQRPAGENESCSATLRALYARPQSEWPAPSLSAGVAHRPLSAMPSAVYTAENLYSESREKLGKKLFHDPGLSQSGQIACANCHAKQLAFTDRLHKSFGHDRQEGQRNALSILNAGHQREFSWTGRAASLEAQALIAISHPKEMAADPRQTLAYVRAQAHYQDAFAAAYGAEQISIQTILKALAVFIRSRNSRSKFDLFMRGKRTLLNDQELLGLHLFRTKARCMNCHSGPLLTDHAYHNLGLHFYGRKGEDLGRYYVTGRARDVGAFRTPSLRAVKNTGPWMHTGLFSRLDFVINAYNAGGYRPKPKGDQIHDPLFPTTSPLLQKLGLTAAEKQALKAFLETL